MGVSGVLAIAALILFRAVLMPFLLAIVLAYVLSPVVTAGERLRIGARGVPRWAVVLVVYTVLLGVGSVVVALSVPRLAGELTRLAREAPRAVATVRHDWLPEQIGRAHV